MSDGLPLNVGTVAAGLGILSSLPGGIVPAAVAALALLTAYGGVKLADWLVERAQDSAREFQNQQLELSARNLELAGVTPSPAMPSSMRGSVGSPVAVGAPSPEIPSTINPLEYDTPEARALALEAMMPSELANVLDPDVARARAAADEAARVGIKNMEDEAARAEARSAVQSAEAVNNVVISGAESINWALPLTGAGLLTGAHVLAKAFAQEGHQQTLKCMTSTGSALLSRIMGAALPAALPAAFMLNPQLQSFAQGLAAKALDTLYSPLEKQAPITPDKAPGVGVNLLLQAVLMGTGAHLMAVTAEASAPLKSMGMGYLSAFLADMAGFSRIAAAFQGMMIQWGLSQPMRYWALEKFRPMIPSERDLISLAGEGAIDKQKFIDMMRYHGYPDEWIWKLWELRDRAMSPSLFRFLAEAGGLTPELLDRELAEAGYNEKSRPAIKDAFMRLAAGELKGQFMPTVLKAYREGYLPVENLEEALREFGYQGVQLDRALKRAILEKVMQRLGDEKSAQEKAEKARSDRAEYLAERARTLFLEQHKQGVISSDALRVRLASTGLSGEELTLEVQLAELRYNPKQEVEKDPVLEKLQNDMQSKQITLYTLLYRKDSIDEDQFEEALMSIGLPEPLVEVSVALEMARKLPTSKRQ